MVYDEIVIKNGDIISQLANDYGYKTSEWEQVWNHPLNSSLRTQRGSPTQIMSGDKVIIPLPWKITSKIMTPTLDKKFRIDVKRDGTKGKNLKWVQTVFGDNQPLLPPSPFSVDWPDDDEPFYWTEAEIMNDPSLRSHFSDKPSRNAPIGRSTHWRGVLSLCSVSGKRVSIFETIVWGVNFGTNGVNTKYQPRPATDYEIEGHLRLLSIGKGKTQTFKSLGWTFRRAPKN